ncbi:MAG: hypothetical protein A4E24_01648 [Methanomethylovorans sp. PtaU1.Bin093]|uniref:hypothetical protein n=1 Tax=Methanomethylovorans sp. PtaU1.Bin093 TaxID=1811679 RepID=UPI0009C6745B|nr:hypothetical protein [Methanomethylovorans sp. PtaU1.Bin093]OPY19489.1 MAG: hypothetical protein A4E24_01648 [Methanomethylovorans sp. PtaU1.Bin093]
MHDLYKLYVLLERTGYTTRITRWEYVPSGIEASRNDSPDPSIIAIEKELSPEQLKEQSIDAFLEAKKDNISIIAFNVPPPGFPDDSEPLIRRTELITPRSFEELEEMERAGYKITDVPNNLERMETPIISGNDTAWKLPLYINGKKVMYKLESFRLSRMQNIRTLLELGQPVCEFTAERTLIFDTLDALGGHMEAEN